MKKKLISTFLCVAMAVVMAAGCGDTKESGTTDSTAGSSDEAGAGDETEDEADDGAGEAKENADNITMGSVIMNTSGEWFAEVMTGQQAAADELGIKLEMVSADNDISTEYDKVDAFVSQGVDALVICPISFESSVAAVEIAKDAGVPVVNWNTTINTDTTSFIGVDATALGGNTGDYMVDFVKEKYPDGCKLAIIGNSSYEIGIARCDGFKSAIQGLVEEGLVTIVNEQDAESQDEGYDITEQLLTANPDIDVIWAWNQTSLLGTCAYLATNGKSDIVVMGTDMSVELAKYMQGDDITLEAVTTQQPYELGYQAVMNAYKAVKGEDMEQTVMIPVYTYAREKTDEIQEYIDEHADLVE